MSLPCRFFIFHSLTFIVLLPFSRPPHLTFSIILSRFLSTTSSLSHPSHSSSCAKCLFICLRVCLFGNHAVYILVERQDKHQTAWKWSQETVAVILPLCVVLITHLIIALDLFYQEKQVAIAPPERPVRSWQSPIPHPQHLGKPAASGFAVTMSLSTNFWITMPISRLTGLIRYEGVKNLPAFVHLSNWSNTEKPFTSMRTQTKLHSQPGPHCLW